MRDYTTYYYVKLMLQECESYVTEKESDKYCFSHFSEITRTIKEQIY